MVMHTHLKQELKLLLPSPKNIGEERLGGELRLFNAMFFMLMMKV